jgi:hypothetical protein
VVISKQKKDSVKVAYIIGVLLSYCVTMRLDLDVSVIRMCLGTTTKGRE